jgi:hypothetical protein
MLAIAISAVLVVAVVANEAIISTNANGDLIINSSQLSQRIILNGIDVLAARPSPFSRVFQVTKADFSLVGGQATVTKSFDVTIPGKASDQRVMIVDSSLTLTYSGPQVWFQVYHRLHFNDETRSDVSIVPGTTQFPPITAIIGGKGVSYADNCRIDN